MTRSLLDITRDMEALDALLAEVEGDVTDPRVLDAVTAWFAELDADLKGTVADAFRRRHEVQAFVLAVIKVKSNVLKAVEAKDPLYTDILPSRFQADCANVIRQLKAAMPHAACPYCRAAGCKACHGRGWVGELAWNAAPKELKQ